MILGGGTAAAARPIFPHPENGIPEASMDKLRLELEFLVVETFDPSPGAAGRGTVVGHDSHLTGVAGCGSACGVCSVGVSECQCSGNSCYVFCTANATCASCQCPTAVSCDGTCYESPCIASGSWTCDGSTCAGTCGSTCQNTCGCTEGSSCNCP